LRFYKNFFFKNPHKFLKKKFSKFLKKRDVKKNLFANFYLRVLFELCFCSGKQVKELKLKNGLTVFLNEDNTQPTVYGAVVVKGGAKRDPKDATGIAHYLEHMFFKGTEDIGTVNYKKEKVYLDKISVLYDKRKKAKTEKERDAILKEITALTTKANEFAIPNEIDKILENMGCENVNAFTSHDAIVYFNSMPSNQIERWLEVYSNRFEKNLTNVCIKFILMDNKQFLGQ